MKKDNLVIVEKGRSSPSVLAEDIRWEPSGDEGDPTGRFLAKLVVAGVSMHLEAWAVHYDVDGIQRSCLYQDDFENLVETFNTDGNLDTIEMGGREYVLTAHPFSCGTVTPGAK